MVREQQPYLNRIYKALQEALPDTTEKISWSMPTFWKKHNIIHFAAFQKHVGIYHGTEAVIHFAEKLKAYKTSKGGIQIPYAETGDHP